MYQMNAWVNGVYLFSIGAGRIITLWACLASKALGCVHELLLATTYTRLKLPRLRSRALA